MSYQDKEGWLAPLATILSLLACYGTLVAIGLLGVLGVTIAVNETAWAGAIILFAGLTIVALLIRRRRHGRFTPIVLAGIGFLLLGFTMLISYERIVELAGFVLLCAGTVLDWRIERSEPSMRA